MNKPGISKFGSAEPPAEVVKAAAVVTPSQMFPEKIPATKFNGDRLAAIGRLTSVGPKM